MSKNEKMCDSHDAYVFERRYGEDFHGRAECSCGWFGPWRNTLWSMRRPLRDANRHNRKANR